MIHRLKENYFAYLIALGILSACSKAETITPATTTGTTPTTITPTTPTTNSTYNDLWIPPTLTGTTFNLTLDKATKQFLPGTITNTYGYNGANFWGPTLIMNKGDQVQINVKNNLSETTTSHWHGFHIPAEMDGGPHQTVAAGATWSPTFKVMNNASTYWYHPHLHELTAKQISYGAGGFIIIKDPEEAALKLPRTYGIDDIPLMLTSRRFTTGNVIEYSGAYGDYQLTNGIMNSQVTLPKQVVRFRILNAEIERGYNLGFSDNRTFYIIANDGGLLDTPVPVTRVKLVVGERIEILVDLSKDAQGASIDFKAYNANQGFGFGGSEPAQQGQFGSLLNNKDFNLLHINVGAATSTPITALPTTLVKNTYWTAADATNSRTISVTGGQPNGPAFSFDNKSYDHLVFNQTIKLNAIEKWTIVNNNVFGHSFHIHDIQFKILSRSSGAVGVHESGWKDTVYLPVGESVTVIAKYDDFASSKNAFMYHCHFSNHEDGGMMGQFLVIP
jgi:bilirubin oxidase